MPQETNKSIKLDAGLILIASFVVALVVLFCFGIIQFNQMLIAGGIAIAGYLLIVFIITPIISAKVQSSNTLD